MAESLVVYTIGHSNLDPDGFLELLKQHHVETVVDVRSVPYSRYAPHFNKSELESLLQDHGVRYAFAGEFLGGRPRSPACYKTGVVPHGKVDYLKLVDYPTVAKQAWFQRGLKRLIEIAQVETTAIMCSEEDPMRCHRHHLIEPSLRQAGLKVAHVRKDGKVEVLDDCASTAEAKHVNQLDFVGIA